MIPCATDDANVALKKHPGYKLDNQLTVSVLPARA